MNILRQGKAGGRLALFAMLVQLAFAFGHVDLPGHHGDSELERVVGHLFAPNSRDHGALHDHHHNHSHNHDFHREHRQGDDDTAHDDCPTCWTFEAAGALILPVTVQHLPSYSLLEAHQSAIVLAFLPLSLPPYQGRAPPFMPVI